MVNHRFGYNAIHGTMEAFDLVCGWFVRFCVKLLNAKQTTNFSHYAAIHFLALVTKNRQRTPKVREKFHLNAV